jgi:hypothetical protein
MALVVVREIVVRNVIPGRTRADECAELRADAGVAIKRSEADGDLFALRPLPAKKARTAYGTKGLHTSTLRPKDPDQLFTRD